MTIKTHWWQLITVTNQSSLIETFKCYLLVSITFALFPSKVWFSTNKSYPNYRDGGGTIDSSEVTEMLKGLFSMAGVSEPTSWDNSDTFFCLVMVQYFHIAVEKLSKIFFSIFQLTLSLPTWLSYSHLNIV